MRTLILLLLTVIFFFTCSREWDNILNTDEDLKNTPQILQFNLDAYQFISISH